MLTLGLEKTRGWWWLSHRIISIVRVLMQLGRIWAVKRSPLPDGPARENIRAECIKTGRSRWTTTQIWVKPYKLRFVAVYIMTPSWLQRSSYWSLPWASLQASLWPTRSFKMVFLKQEFRAYLQSYSYLLWWNCSGPLVGARASFPSQQRKNAWDRGDSRPYNPTVLA